MCAVGTLLMVAMACQHVVRDPHTPPGPPIPAEPELDLAGMDAECAGLVAALDTYARCPNLDEVERQATRRTMEAAQQTFAAGTKAEPDEPSQRAIALACHRAARSIRYATQRCQAGKRPPVDW